MTSEQAIVFLVMPLAGYVAGSVSFAFLIGKSRGVDIRTAGSKNVGATNLGRVLGKKYFWMAFLLDALKGFLPVLIAAMLVRQWNAQWQAEGGQMAATLQNMLSSLPGVTVEVKPALPMWAPLLTGAACVIGHLFPVWLKFKGGKGVSTGFGVVLGFWPLYTLAGLIAGAFFVFMLLVYRYISLASMTASVVFVGMVAWLGHWRQDWPTYLEWRELWPLVAVAGIFSLMIILRHRPNIGRLLKGTEPKVGKREVEKAKLKG